MHDALRGDAILAPGRRDCYWLLYIPGRRGHHDDMCGGDVIACSLCNKCAAALKKRDRRGVPRPEMPYCARARGLWGGPEPRVIAVLTYLERRVVQLARVYVAVKRVLGKSVPWAKGNVDAMPQYTTKNTVACPNDPSKVVRAICLLPDELCADLAVQFVSSLEDAYQEPALQVSVARVRAAIWWLSSNCWPWMEQTKFMEVLSIDRLGSHLERIVAAYQASVGITGVGVPRELLGTAT